MQVWYPAEPAADAVSMPYKGYLNVSSGDPSLQDFIEALNTFLFETACQESMGQRWADLAADDAKTFETLLHTPSACYSDAPPIKSPFPALVYHQGLGGSLVDNPTLLEFLASYGYVVATSTFQPDHGLFFGVDSNTNRSIKDMACLINALCQQYAVDPTRLGLLGHSYGASAVLGCAAEAQANIRAVVSLDSTREWDAECEPLYKDIAERLSQAISSMPPLIIFSMAKPTVRFNHYDALTYADRYYIAVKHLAHNDFVTPGPTATTLLAQKPDEQDQLIRATSKVICESILAFFDAYLKGDEPHQHYLENALQTLNQNLQALSIQVCQAEPQPLSAKQWLDVFLTQGAATGCEQITQAATAVAPETLMKVGRALEERGLYEEALLLYQTLNQQFPDFSSAYEAAGDIYHYQLKDSAKARTAYQAALETLPRDATLSAEQKAYRQNYLTEDIAALM